MSVLAAGENHVSPRLDSWFLSDLAVMEAAGLGSSPLPFASLVALDEPCLPPKSPTLAVDVQTPPPI